MLTGSPQSHVLGRESKLVVEVRVEDQKFASTGTIPISDDRLGLALPSTLVDRATGVIAFELRASYSIAASSNRRP